MKGQIKRGGIELKLQLQIKFKTLVNLVSSGKGVALHFNYNKFKTPVEFINEKTAVKRGGNELELQLQIKFKTLVNLDSSGKGVALHLNYGKYSNSRPSEILSMKNNSKKGWHYT